MIQHFLAFIDHHSRIPAKAPTSGGARRGG
jgi:hypothetical protein